MKLLYVFALVLTAASCMAQTPVATHAQKTSDCKDITTSPQLDACVHNKMVKSNSLLNNEISNVEKRVKQAYTDDPKLGKELIEKIHKAQRAWANFRRLNCNVEAFEIEKGTPAYNTIVNNCIIQMNARRIVALKKLAH